MVTLVIGWTGAVLSTVLGVPQMVKLWRTRDTAGLSVFFWQLKVCIDIIWFSHGLILCLQGSNAWNMVVPNGLSAIVTGTVIVLLHQTRGIGYFRLLAPGLAMAAAFVAADFFVGSFVFGLLSSIPSVLANGGQSISLVRSRSISGVAPFFLLAYTVNQIVWVAWGHLMNDAGTIITSWVTGVLVWFNMLWWLLRRAGVPALFAKAGADGVG
ncbi:MAG: hypothetical protein LBQ92_00865 [Propionibacteriaceae bacterium]|nr:hypothetical protein [Propionibacteriaceae bacterium]